MHVYILLSFKLYYIYSRIQNIETLKTRIEIRKVQKLCRKYEENVMSFWKQILYECNLFVIVIRLLSETFRHNTLARFNGKQKSSIISWKRKNILSCATQQLYLYYCEFSASAQFIISITYQICGSIIQLLVTIFFSTYLTFLSYNYMFLIVISINIQNK